MPVAFPGSYPYVNFFNFKNIFTAQYGLQVRAHKFFSLCEYRGNTHMLKFYVKTAHDWKAITVQKDSKSII